MYIALFGLLICLAIFLGVYYLYKRAEEKVRESNRRLVVVLKQQILLLKIYRDCLKKVKGEKVL